MNYDFESGRFLLLMECLRYALLPYRALDKYVRSLLGEDGPGGGDPGWWIIWIENEGEAVDPDAWRTFMDSDSHQTGCFEAWLDDEMGISNPLYGYYSKEEVFAGVREKLHRIESEWPERSAEARSLSLRFKYP